MSIGNSSGFAAALRDLARQAGTTSQPNLPNMHQPMHPVNFMRGLTAVSSQAPVVTITPTLNTNNTTNRVAMDNITGLTGRLPPGYPLGLIQSSLLGNPQIANAAGIVNQADLLHQLGSSLPRSSVDAHHINMLQQQQQLAMMHQYKAIEATLMMQQLAEMNNLGARHDPQYMILEQYQRMAMANGLLSQQALQPDNNLLLQDIKMRQQLAQQQALLRLHTASHQPLVTTNTAPSGTPPPPYEANHILSSGKLSTCTKLPKAEVEVSKPSSSTSDNITFRPYSGIVDDSKPAQPSPTKLYRPFEVERSSSNSTDKREPGSGDEDERSVTAQLPESAEKSVIDSRMDLYNSGQLLSDGEHEIMSSEDEEAAWRKQIITTPLPCETDGITKEKLQFTSTLSLCTRKRKEDIMLKQASKRSKHFLEEEGIQLNEVGMPGADINQEDGLESDHSAELSPKQQQLMPLLKLKPTTESEREELTSKLAMCEQERQLRQIRKQNPLDSHISESNDDLSCDGKVSDINLVLQDKDVQLPDTQVIKNSVKVAPLNCQKSSEKSKAVVLPETRQSHLSTTDTQQTHLLAPDFAQQFHESVFKETFNRTPHHFDSTPRRLLASNPSFTDQAASGSVQWPGMEILMQAHHQHMQNRF